MIATAVALVIASTSSYYSVQDTGVERYRLAFHKLNNRGEAIGTQVFPDPRPSYGLYWKDGKLREVHAPGEGALWFHDINDQGVVVGVIDPENNGGLGVPFLWTADDGFQSLASGGGEFCPMSINNRGVVAGQVTTYGPGAQKWLVTWSPQDGFKRLLELDWVADTTSRINDRGDLLYTINNPGRSKEPWGPFLLPAGEERARLLSSVPDLEQENHLAPISAAGLNDNGWVCGSTYPEDFPAGAKLRGTLWTPENELAQVARGAYLFQINDSNVAIGKLWSRPSWLGEPVVWDQTNGVRTLNSVVPIGSPTFERVASINDKGEILAYGRNAAGARHWYILKPN